MKLEHLCDMTARYVGDSVWIKPYGEKEVAGYGQGEGEVTGERLSGTMHWTNHPQQREDGVFCPDVHGYIVTEDDAKILFTVQGYSFLEGGPEEYSGLLMSATFKSSEPQYRWLNYVFGVSEGYLDAERGELRMKVYECMNEVASTPAETA